MIQETTQLNNKEIENVMLEASTAMNIKDSIRILWNCFKTLEGGKEFVMIRDQVLWGVTIEFDIRNVIYGEVEEYYTTNSVLIKGYDKMNLSEYWDELESRQRIMMKYIREEYDEGQQGERENNEYD